MEIGISYFYQIRFFKPNQIPISTAVWDPKWFHKNKGNNFIFKDKNNVINGIRFNSFSPGKECDGLCSGLENCSCKDPNICEFLKTYSKQINKLDINKVLKQLDNLGDQIQNKTGINKEDLEYIFIVYEPPNKPCSERQIIIKYFQDNGIDCNEFKK